MYIYIYTKYIYITYLYIYTYGSVQFLWDSVPIGSLQWSSSMWFPWWLPHGAWTQWRDSIWENADKRTSEFTHFNLVVRLSILKQSAIPFTTILQLLAAPVVLANPRQISILLKSDCWNSRSWPFMTESAYDSIRSYHLACKATGMSFSWRYGLFGSFWYLVRLNILCT